MVVKRYEGQRPKAGRLAGALLFVLPLPLIGATVISLGSGRVITALAAACAFGLFYLAAGFLRKGVALEHEAQRRRIMRRRSTVPWKLVSAITAGFATSLAAFFVANDALINSLLLGVAASVSCVMWYGRDPASALPKGVPTVGITAEEVIEALDEAEAKLEAIEASGRVIQNQELEERLLRICAGVREILDLVADDPRDLRRARKFLKVYLEGAERVTRGYAKAHQMAPNAVLEGNFRRVLATIETTLVEQRQKLAENNLSELDVQIEVLQMQLEKEGV